MGKIEQNKEQKRTALLEAGLKLFSRNGVNRTTISEIAAEAGLAKGTFYLYFDDKYQLQNELVRLQMNEIIRKSLEILHKQGVPKDFTETILQTMDVMLDVAADNINAVEFCAKSLSWDLCRELAHEHTEMREAYQRLVDRIEEEHLVCERPDLMVFTLLELASSTAHRCLTGAGPVSLDKYRPWLRAVVRKITEVYVMPA